ncbi:MAG TPA: hypothetical protein VLV86_00065 [Vicinamibacterales bacterium]|nr:hypothetical protein [Vicinamibacterales bacterium]
MRRITTIRSRVASLVVAAAPLAGCWTAPIATVQPDGEPRLIQRAIPTESVKRLAIVQSVDASSRTISILTPGESAVTAPVDPGVRNLDRIKAGDKVRATLAEELTVYVLRDGQLPGPGGVPETIATDARVLSVDASYRLLTLQFPNGGTETLKVGRQVRLDEMRAGDEVVIRTVKIVALQVRK